VRVAEGRGTVAGLRHLRCGIRPAWRLRRSAFERCEQTAQAAQKALTSIRPRTGADRKPSSIEESAVADVVSVVLIVAVFVVLALVIKGVERLER
jgi:hypothetical protein